MYRCVRTCRCLYLHIYIDACLHACDYMYIVIDLHPYWSLRVRIDPDGCTLEFRVGGPEREMVCKMWEHERPRGREQGEGWICCLVGSVASFTLLSFPVDFLFSRCHGGWLCGLCVFCFSSRSISCSPGSGCGNSLAGARFNKGVTCKFVFGCMYLIGATWSSVIFCILGFVFSCNYEFQITTQVILQVYFLYYFVFFRLIL